MTSDEIRDLGRDTETLPYFEQNRMILLAEIAAQLAEHNELARASFEFAKQNVENAMATQKKILDDWEK